MARHRRHAARAFATQEIHARRADEVADEHVLRSLEQGFRRAHLHRTAPAHHDDLLGKGQRLDLVMRHVDQGQLQFVMNLLELAAQLPFELRVDDGQRFIEQHGRHILAHQTAAERDLLLGIGRQTGRTLVELRAHLQHLGDLADAGSDLVRRHATILQRKGEVLGHRHGVVDDGELEHLRDVARLRRQRSHVAPVEQHLALRGRQQARDDIEHRRFAAAGRPQQGIGATVLERHLQRQQGVVAVLLRMGRVGVREVEIDLCHQASRRGASSSTPCASNT